MAGRFGDDRWFLPPFRHRAAGAVQPGRPRPAGGCLRMLGSRPLCHGRSVERARACQTAAPVVDSDSLHRPARVACPGRLRGRGFRARSHLCGWIGLRISDDLSHHCRVVGCYRPHSEHRARLHRPSCVLLARSSGHNPWWASLGSRLLRYPSAGGRTGLDSISRSRSRPLLYSARTRTYTTSPYWSSQDLRSPTLLWLGSCDGRMLRWRSSFLPMRRSI